MPIDILFMISLAYGFWQGFNQGVISTVFNVGAYIFGITLAFKLTATTTNIMEAIFHSNNPTLYLAAFVVNVVTIMFIVRMAAKSLEKALQAAYIGIVNQALGAILLGGFYILICSVLVWFMVKAQFLNKETIADSKTYPLLEPLPGKAYDMALRFKPLAEDAWGTSMNWMDRLQKYGDDKTKKTGEETPKIYKPGEENSIENDPASSDRQPAKTSYPAEDSDGIEE